MFGTPLNLTTIDPTVHSRAAAPAVLRLDPPAFFGVTWLASGFRRMPRRPGQWPEGVWWPVARGPCLPSLVRRLDRLRPIYWLSVSQTAAQTAREALERPGWATSRDRRDPRSAPPPAPAPWLRLRLRLRGSADPVVSDGLTALLANSSTGAQLHTVVC